MREFLRFIVRMLLAPIIYPAAWIYQLYMQQKRRTKFKLVYKDIVDGFSYMVVKDSEVEKVAKQRAKKCAVCPHADYINKHKSTVIVGSDVYSVKSMKCKVCGCALSAKVRAMDSECPRGFWGARKDIA